jgi:NADH:ubiquinone oxidoreductase subunit D
VSTLEDTAASLALEPETELMTINLGPHHPATHGVLRLIVQLEGEVVRDLKPVLGYVHTGIEKSCEDKSYWKVIPFVERMDYVSFFFQMEVFCGAVERLVELEIPPRAKYLRVIHLELNRIHSHLVWLGTTALDLGAVSMLWYCFRERDRILDLFEMSTGQRMHTRYFQVGGVFEDIPLGFEQKLRSFIAEMPVRVGQYLDLLDRNEIFLNRTKNVSVCSSSASRDRCCGRPGSPGTCARPSTTSPTATSTSGSRSAPWATGTTATGSASPRSSSRCGSSSRRSTGCPKARSSPTTASTCCRRDLSYRPRWRR